METGIDIRDNAMKMTISEAAKMIFDPAFKRISEATDCDIRIYTVYDVEYDCEVVRIMVRKK